MSTTDASLEETRQNPLEGTQDPVPSASVKQKKVRKDPVALVRESGKSLLPFSRVQKIVKADKEIPIIAKDATFLISLATEEFIKRLAEAGKAVADREKRATVQHKDIATVVRRADEFLFLEEIIPWMSTDPVVKRKPIGTKEQPTMHQFVVKNKEAAATDEESEDIIMNEDGTMDGGGDDNSDGEAF